MERKPRASCMYSKYHWVTHPQHNTFHYNRNQGKQRKGYTMEPHTRARGQPSQSPDKNELAMKVSLWGSSPPRLSLKRLSIQIPALNVCEPRVWKPITGSVYPTYFGGLSSVQAKGANSHPLQLCPAVSLHLHFPPWLQGSSSIYAFDHCNLTNKLGPLILQMQSSTCSLFTVYLGPTHHPILLYCNSPMECLYSTPRPDASINRLINS